MNASGGGRIVAVLVLILVTLAGGLVGILLDRTLLLPRHHLGGPPPMRPGFGRGDDGFRERERRFRDHMARELGLSDAQRQELLAVARKCPLHKLMAEATTEISTELAGAADTP